VKNVQRYLNQTYPQFNDILILTDDQRDPSKIPTRINIENGLRWLVNGAAPGDRFFLHYSGHGGSAVDKDGDEADGKDETICPLDYARYGQIIDDQLHQMICMPLPRGAKLTAIFDSCHSGSILDLPFTYSVDSHNNLVKKDNRVVAAKHALAGVMAYSKGDTKTAMKEAKNAFGAFFKSDKNVPSIGNTPPSGNGQTAVQGKKITQGTCIMFSGCKDEQTSADAHIEGSHTGALSHALLSVLGQGGSKSYLTVLKETRVILFGKYTQVPQLSTGFEMDMNEVLSFV
jgi:hypothetical protein